MPLVDHVLPTTDDRASRGCRYATSTIDRVIPVELDPSASSSVRSSCPIPFTCHGNSTCSKLEFGTTIAIVDDIIRRTEHLLDKVEFAYPYSSPSIVGPIPPWIMSELNVTLKELNGNLVGLKEKSEEFVQMKRKNEELSRNNDELGREKDGLEKKLDEKERELQRKDKQDRRKEQLLQWTQKEIQDLQAAYCQIGDDRQLSEEDAAKLVEQYSHWLSTQNVVSLGYCSERAGRNTTCRQVLRVGVYTVLPPQQDTDREGGIPHYVEFEVAPGDHVIVLVRQVKEGPIKLLGAPYESGCHIHTEGHDQYGSSAAVVSFRGSRRLLSAAHVLTGFDERHVDKPVEMRSDDRENWTEVGRVSGHSPVRVYDRDGLSHLPDTEKATEDLAWCEVSDQVLPNSIKEIGIVEEDHRLPVDGEVVKLFGGKSETKIQEDDNVTVDGITSRCMDAQFREAQVCVFSPGMHHSNSSVLSEGDSGSAVVAATDDKVIGVVFSHNPISKSTYFCKI